MGTTSYRRRDYAFGEKMQTLRTETGLTQAGLANKLGVSRRTVGDWEAGSSYPKVEHLKEVIALGVEHQAFPKDSVAEEIRALWSAAHQRVLLDERWLASLFDHSYSRHLHLVPHAVEESMTVGTGPCSCPPVEPLPASKPRVDWGDALTVPSFYGREEELVALSHWIVQEHCRVVSVLGMGGIGKSALSVKFAVGTVASESPFEVIIFRSLRDAPSCSALLDGCLRVLSLQPLSVRPSTLEQRISLLLSHLRTNRVLLVLDNLECLLEAEDVRGRFRRGFEGYWQLLRWVAETGHQSCLLFTSREQPAELRLLECNYTALPPLDLSQ